MAMFLMIVSHNLRNRVVRNRFKHSTQTVHKCFHEVLADMMKFSKEMITPPSFNGNCNGISNHRLRQIFKRGCYQNVMAICDFDMIFRYVAVGSEGTAQDLRVLTETIHNPSHNFPMPPNDKYYLVDAAYSHTKGFIAPYQQVRYWLGDFRNGGRANGKEEIFNHSHSKLRNVIERAFGVLKARFPILKRMSPYSFYTQKNIVIACIALHNFLRQISIDDELFSLYEDEELIVENEMQIINYQIQTIALGHQMQMQYLCNGLETISLKNF
ncbi:hypothetical protein Dsin_028571 [Dipteronia sinensis]|uniref:DDE Tnp4 domain-containing protein n=1 Tax=Dipteronia sinensis TaxID=43782 RepID=A0AAE0DUJ4_9ROSI|nr:hypothetical protein Dsin_028571 [Dipteronia sinensis]